MKVIIELTAKEATDAMETGVLALLLNNEAYSETAIGNPKEEKETAPEPSQTASPKPATSVATTTPTYTMDEIAKACAPLMDKGLTAQLQSLVQSFGVASLADLAKEHYGAFVLKLRELGAAI